MTPTLKKVDGQSRFACLAEALDAAASGETGYSFYDARGELEHVLSYRVLRQDAVRLAKKLKSLDLPRGSRIAIVAETNPLFHKYFFACQYAGFIPVPVPAAIQLGGQDAYVMQLRRLLQSCLAAAAIAPDNFIEFLQRAAAPLDMALCGGESDFEALPDLDCSLEPLSTGEAAYLQYTSGSTQFPRGVEMTQEAAINNLREICDHGVKVTSADRLVSWLPFYHDMGLGHLPA